MKRILAKTCLLALCLGATSALAGTVTVTLIDSGGNAINGAQVRTYYEGIKGNTGDTTPGTLTFSDAKTTDSVYLTYGGHTKTWANQNIAGNPTLTAQTTKVTVDLKSCSTGLSLAATPDQWGNLPTFKAYFGGAITGGSIEMLPGTDSFYVDWETREQTKANVAITDGGATHQQAITFYTTKVTITGPGVSFYNNSPISGFGPFTSPMEMLQVNWNFKVGGTTFPVDLTSNPCSFTKAAVQIRLISSTGAGIAGGTVYYFNGGSSYPNLPGATDANGNLFALIDGSANREWHMTSAFLSTAKQQDAALGPVVFQTKKVTVELRDSSGSLMDLGTGVRYWGNGANRTFGSGSTSGGKVTMELLPMNIEFGMTYLYTTIVKSQDVAANATVTFQTGKVNSTGGTCWSYWMAGDLRPFTSGMELFPANYEFHFTDLPTAENFAITAGVNTIR